VTQAAIQAATQVVRVAQMQDQQAAQDRQRAKAAVLTLLEVGLVQYRETQAGHVESELMVQSVAQAAAQAATQAAAQLAVQSELQKLATQVSAVEVVTRAIQAN